MATPELKTLGRYTIERVLGKGAMGIVYEGVDPRLNRRVAIKTILKSHLDDDTAKDFAIRFVREAQAVARLNHPNIVQIHDFGEEGEIAYLVMEFIKGKELKDFFDANERFDLKEAVRIMGELCDALEFAHQAGIVHRDVKPRNVMLDAQMRAKLTDFGVARLQDGGRTHTTQGTMVGTPAYMSPEQITGSTIDKRSDVFSAGVVLYQFLTGDMPFGSGGAWTIAKKIMQDDPPRPSSVNTSLTPLFDAVVNKALAKDPGQRYQSARDLKIALQRALEGRRVEDDSNKTVVASPRIAPKPTPPAPKPSPAVAGSGTGTQTGSQEVELEFWRAIKDGNDPNDFELYVEQFPNGIYAKLAKSKIAKLRGIAPEETGLKARQQEEQDKREAEEAARREAEVKAKLEAAARAKADAEAKARREAEFAKREAELKKREREAADAAALAPGAPRKSSPILPIVIGVLVAAVAGASWFALAPRKADDERLAALEKQIAESGKRDAELQQAREREARAVKELELAKQREAEAKKSGDVARQNELAAARAKAEAEAKKQGEQAKVAQVAQAESAKKADAARSAQAEAEKRKAESARQAQEKQAAAVAAAQEKAAAAERAASERIAAAEKAAEEKIAAAEKSTAMRAAAERAPAEKLAAELRAAGFPAVGDSWVYRHTDLWTRDTVQITHTVTAASKSKITENLSRQGRSLTSIEFPHAPEIRPWTLEPVSLPEFAPFAMAAGLLKQGKAITDVKGMFTIPVVKWSVSATVQGDEDVSVPAGRFRATKVVLRGSGVSTDTVESRSTVLQGPLGYTRAIRFEMNVWYAPEFKRYIKSTYNSFNNTDQAFDRIVYELVSAAPAR